MKQKLKNAWHGLCFGNTDTPLSMSYTGITRFAPLLVVGGFFVVTILLFTFGPLDWHISNPLKLYGFLAACVLALTGGYLLAVYKTKMPQKQVRIDIEKLLIIGVIVYFLMYIPTVYVTTGKLYPDIYTGITNTGLAYRTNKMMNETASPLILYVRMLVSPLMIFVTPIAIYFISKLSLKGKILGISVIVLTTFLGIAQGINKNVADITAQLVLALMIVFFAGNGETRKKIWAHRMKILAIILVVCLLFVLYYANSMTNRVSADLEDDPAFSDDADRTEEERITDAMSTTAQFSFGTPKEGYFLDKILPARLVSVVSFLSSYLSHGYKGLSFALEHDFTSTYGLGFSDFLRHNFLKVIGFGGAEDAVEVQTYYGKIGEDSWPTGMVWSTFFVYPASDIGFVLTVLLVAVIGFLFGLSWKHALLTQNPFALSSFFGFSTMIFYFSANNQMFQGGENFFGFIAMLLLWAVSHLYYQKKA